MSEILKNTISSIPMAVIVYSSFPRDVRVRRETETLLIENYKIDLFCLRRKGEGQLSREKGENINIYRSLPVGSRGFPLKYVFEYLYFTFATFLKVSILFFRSKYKLVHVHNMPDFLVFAALIPKIFGAKILLDLHDPTPEVFMAKYNVNKNNFFIKVLSFIEKISLRFADFIVTPNMAFKELFVERGCREDKIDILMNVPMEKITNRYANTLTKKIEEKQNPFIIMYHGTIVERHGLSTALDAILILKDKIPGLKFNVFGRGDYLEKFLLKIKSKNVEDIVSYKGSVFNEKIFDYIEKCNLGIIPNHFTRFTNLNLPVRIFEYLALKKPVIVPRTKGITDYFDENSINFFDAGDPKSLAERILDVYNNGEKQNKILEQGFKIYQNHTWSNEQEVLIKVVKNLIQ